MTHSLQIAVWIANGLSRHRHEVQMFHLSHNIDVLLISKTHFTKSYFRHPNYTTYHTNHPSGSARGGSAIIIKNSIKHKLLNSNNLPPKHTITHEHLSTFFSSLGHRFLTGGDYNTKHTIWGSRLNNPRTYNPKNYRTPQLHAPILWLTHLLANRQKQNP
jgi:hypothetical protein